MIQELILHSVSYSGSWGQHALTVEEFVDKAADLGYEGVMFMAKRPHLSVLDWDLAARRRLRARLESRGLSTICIAGYTNFTADLEHGDIPHREIQIRHVADLAEMASDLGGRLVRVFTGYESAAATPHAQWKMIVSSLRECARRAAQAGVTITTISRVASRAWTISSGRWTSRIAGRCSMPGRRPCRAPTWLLPRPGLLPNRCIQRWPIIKSGLATNTSPSLSTT